MKIETKRKIIRFVSRLIGYKDYSYAMQTFEEQRLKLNHIRVQYQCTEVEWQGLDLVFVTHENTVRIVEALKKSGAVKTTVDIDERRGIRIVKTELRYVQ